MKTTLELPDDLICRVKILAAQQNKKLKDIVAEIMERGLSQMKPRRMVVPKPAKLKGRGPLTIDEIEAAINWGRE